MTEIAILVGCAAIAFAIARSLKIPAVPVLLVAGYLLGQTGILQDEAIRYDVLILGVSFLLFLVGTELNPERVRQYRPAALKVGSVQFIVLGLAALAAAFALGYDLFTGVHIALAVAASSTLVVVRLLQQRRQMFEPFGRMVIGVLLLQDVIVILVLPFLHRLEAGVLAAVAAAAITALLAVAVFVLHRWVVPLVVRRLHDDDEVLLLFALAVLFVFVGATFLFQLPVVTGAFLAGVALSSFPMSGFVRLQFNSLTDFFASLFFTVLGTLAAINSLMVLLHASVLALLVLIITPPLVTFIAERAGLSSRVSIESGLLLSQMSEISLILGLQAYIAGMLGQDVLSIIILATALTMVLTPFISTNHMTWVLMRRHPMPYRPHYRMEGDYSDHILLLGVGAHGLPLLETLLFAGYDVLVVDDDASLIEDLYRNDVPCLRGDASDRAVLERAGARRAKAIISMIRRPKDNLVVLKEAGSTPVYVRVFEDEDERMIREAGGIPVSFSDAAADEFIAWLRQHDVREAVGRADVNLHD